MRIPSHLCDGSLYLARGLSFHQQLWVHVNDQPPPLPLGAQHHHLKDRQLNNRRGLADFTLFYIAFLIQIKVPGFRQNGCEGSSCMAVLQKQLMVVFTVKQLVSQIKQIVKPKLKRCMRVRKENKSIKKENKKAMMESVDAASAKVISTEFENPLEEEYMYEPYTSTFEDFKEMSIQFGYVTLFAACYPLAGLLAWLNNVTELRLDSYQVCKMHRRSMWRVQEDIGSWGGVFNVLSIICVITNACLVGFVGSQLAPGTASFGERVRRADLWVVVRSANFAVVQPQLFCTPAACSLSPVLISRALLCAQLYALVCGLPGHHDRALRLHSPFRAVVCGAVHPGMDRGR